MKQTKIHFPTPGVYSPPKDLKDAIIRLIAIARLPFTIVSEPAFKQLLEVARTAPKLEIPHRTTLASTELNRLHGEVLSTIKHQFADVKHISLTVYGTTSLSGVPYWSVTVAGLDDSFVMHTAILACVPVFSEHSGKNLSKIVREVLKSCEIEEDKLVAIVTDEGGGAPFIANYFDRVAEIHCAAHLLQTAVRKAFDEANKKHPLIGEVITLARRLATHFNHSTASKQEFQVLQARLSQVVSSLKQDAPTRWLSVLTCLRSVQQNRLALETWLAQVKQQKRPEWSSFSDLSFSSQFWIILPRLITILEAFEEATKNFSVETKPSLHQTVSMYCILHIFLDHINLTIKGWNLSEKLSTIILDLVNGLKSALDTKYLDFHEFELAAFVLDPGNIHPKHQYSAELVEKGFNVVVKLATADRNRDMTMQHHQIHQIPTPTASSSNSALATAYSFLKCSGSLDSAEECFFDEKSVQSEVNRYREQRVQPKDLGGWWNGPGQAYPSLARLARRVFSIPCSQTASEREFSLLRLTCTHVRGRLSPETVNKLITTSAYLRRQEANIKADQMAPRSEANIKADAERVKSLLEWNRKRVVSQAIQRESAAELMHINIDQLLEQHHLPPNIDPEDLDHPSGNITDEAGYIYDDDDYVCSDDESWAGPGPSKMPKQGETHESPAQRKAPGSCYIETVDWSTTEMIGTWTSTGNVQPTPKSIFGQHLKCVDIDDSYLTVDMDGTQYLLPTFHFSLNKTGKKKFPSGRKSFISAIGEIIQFGF